MNTDVLSFEPPRGMRDFYPEDMAVRNAIFKAWIDASRLFGFAHYDACVVESLDLLKRKGGEEIVEQIYAFQDKSGRDLALRPEMTPTLARMIAARAGRLTFPLKWFTLAQCFRYERMSKGRKREHYQWNLDIIGESAITAEAEIIACAIQAMTGLGLTAQDFKVHVSSRSLLSDLLAKSGIAPERHALVFLALDKRGKVDDSFIATLLTEGGLSDTEIAAVFKVSAIRSVDEATAFLGDTPPSITALQQFMDLVSRYGAKDHVEFDISVVRGLGYYTGLVFEAFDSQRQFRALFGGGRYDRLLEHVGGDPKPAVGLGFGDVVIAELLAEKGKLPCGAEPIDQAIGYMEPAQHAVALALARSLRAEGQRVDLALHPEKPKPFFSRVGKGGIFKATYIGPDDILKGSVRVKDLTARTEQDLPLTPWLNSPT